MMVGEIKGMDSYWAFQSFHKLMLGLKMLPSYMGESYESFFDRISLLFPEEQETFIREALVFVPLEKEEIEALAKFVKDPNGIPYTAENMKSLSPDKIHEILTVVCREIVKIKINFVNESEKKKTTNFSIDIRKVFSKHPEISLRDAINIAFYEACQNV